MCRAVLLAVLVIGIAPPSSLMAQDGPTVSLSVGPPGRAYVKSLYYTGGGLLEYICMTPASPGVPTTVTTSVSAATNASPVVFTATAHQFPLGSFPKIVVSGATVGWTAINGTFQATVIDANTLSIAVDSTGFGALSGTVIFTSTYPRLNQSIWSVSKQTYNASSQLIQTGFANGSSAANQACSARVSLYY